MKDAAQLQRRVVLQMAAALAMAGVREAWAGSYEDFFTAVRKDDAAAIQSLLKRGFDPNTLDPQGLTGLLLAVREGMQNAAKALINWPKTDVEIRNAQDESPLMMAVFKGHHDLARLLVEKGGDVNKTGWTPLHYAATKGDLAMIELLLDNHAYIDAESPNKTTPLMMAAMYGSTSAVKALLEAGADPNLKNEQGLGAIDFAHKVNRKDAADIIAAFVRAQQPRGKW